MDVFAILFDAEGNRAGDDALFFGAVAEYIMIKGSAY